MAVSEGLCSNKKVSYWKQIEINSCESKFSLNFEPNPKTEFLAQASTAPYVKELMIGRKCSARKRWGQKSKKRPENNGNNQRNR